MWKKIFLSKVTHICSVTRSINNIYAGKSLSNEQNLRYFNLVPLQGSNHKGLGFDIATSHSSIVVTNVAKGSVADGKLR